VRSFWGSIDADARGGAVVGLHRRNRIVLELPFSLHHAAAFRSQRIGMLSQSRPCLSHMAYSPPTEHGGGNQSGFGAVGSGRDAHCNGDTPDIDEVALGLWH